MKIQSYLPLSLLLLSGFSHANLHTTSSEPIKTGYFIDSPVTGLYYETSSNLSGSTNKGGFNYRQGDVIRFFLGKDNSGYLISSLSAQEVITPTHTTTKPSKSINLTRLLLSLDSTPENREEILLTNKVLSDVQFQQQLKSIDLSTLGESILDLDLVSVDEAVQHLNNSQNYINDNFASNSVIYQPLNIRLTNSIVKRKDWKGKVCTYDLKYKDHPQYHPPMSHLEYKITNTDVIEYPGLGDTFNNCRLVPNKSPKTLTSPLSEFEDHMGLISCAVSGCTRGDLNGFNLDDYQDGDDWKYRTVAINFDPTTQLVMEKTQGLGPTKNIQHANKTELFFFTYPTDTRRNIGYEGIWQQTQYKGQEINQYCLLIQNGRIYKTKKKDKQCSNQQSQYSEEVTRAYQDMWWVEQDSPFATLEQLNISVRWYPPTSRPQYTTWEYLPAGKSWDDGLLYRYQQQKKKNRDGSEDLQTFMISEFKKVAGIN